MAPVPLDRNFNVDKMNICSFNCDGNLADILFMPCGHRVVCSKCVLNTSLHRCPKCYQHILSAINPRGEKVEIGSNVTKSMVDEKGRKDLAESKKVFDEAEIQKIAEEAAEKAKEAAEKEKNELIRELQMKLEQLELEVYCAICMEQRCSVLFQCGHKACTECSNAARLKLCHICREPITRRTRIFT
ncbi:E3 ubiquitin-protein ligase MIB2 [Toxocara canis]|uniref:E3 ubiquitin-protein ligase MIB2 n=1 Tax=Toxocara canis TaxID=6265 RepID=A0A0B2VY13_TOXCA|nr:E3 ubiquitin-protein ligase MIB2 [Toxocara canis]